MVSCKRSSPYFYVIENLKNLTVKNEEYHPFSKNFKLLSTLNSQEYFLLLNAKGTELTGNIYSLKEKFFYEIKGKIDVTGSFYALLYDKNNQPVDSLKGYFQQDTLKCAFTSNYDNILINEPHFNDFIPVNLYSLKLNGKSEKYRFKEQKPDLFVHHTFFLPNDSSLTNLRNELLKTFFQMNTPKIEEMIAKDILVYLKKFEDDMSKIAKPMPADSLSRSWIKCMEIVYNQDSIISFYYFNQKKEGLSSLREFKTFVYNTQTKKFLSPYDLPIRREGDGIKHFLWYPNFVRVWKTDSIFEDIPIKQ
jgi:hypothetical protein